MIASLAVLAQTLVRVLLFQRVTASTLSTLMHAQIAVLVLMFAR